MKDESFENLLAIKPSNKIVFSSSAASYARSMRVLFIGLGVCAVPKTISDIGELDGIASEQKFYLLFTFSKINHGIPIISLREMNCENPTKISASDSESESWADPTSESDGKYPAVFSVMVRTLGVISGGSGMALLLVMICWRVDARMMVPNCCKTSKSEVSDSDSASESALPGLSERVSQYVFCVSKLLPSTAELTCSV